MYTPCLPLTSSGEFTCSWAIHEAICFNSKIEGGGEEEKGSALAVIVSPPMKIESEFSTTKYFTASMTCYYPGLESYRQNSLAKQYVFLDKKTYCH